jgi:UDP-N-acetylmuramoyl-L-alanyl-D-glutamate--2,6-diaminopimelate ligase
MVAERNVSLTALLRRLPEAEIRGDRERAIAGIEIDSRAVRPGTLFVALRGSRTDGHHYLADAVANGAGALIVEAAPPPDIAAGVTVVRVTDSYRALSTVAAAFYGNPSHDLDVIGVTGTNGKTTTTRMVAAILDRAGFGCGVVGTVGAEFGTHAWQLQNTTPLPPTLHRLLAEMRDDGASAVAMEVSSHALALDRVDDVRFRVAVLTNVTRDHLDFHQTQASYAAAKRRLFELAPSSVLNVDDPYGALWASELSREGREVIAYGTRAGATVEPVDIVVEPQTTRFTVDGEPFELHVPGRFNVWNAAAAIAVARLLGIADATSARGLAALMRVPGRMERLHGEGVDVVVDYAHTPDALESALRSLRETTRGALTVVFGCGGDRDRGKRSQMGAVAAKLADRLYLTSDNPRTEEPRAIVDEIVAGIGSAGRTIEVDRRRAIERAIRDARPGDVVLVAGKGHETYQIIGDRVEPFDDVEVARCALAARRALQ